MNTSLLELLKRERLAVAKVRDYEQNVVYYVTELSKQENECFTKTIKEAYERAIAKRDAALVELDEIRKELRKYLEFLMNY